MKRAWRFAKWAFSKCGWFESVLFTTSFCVMAGLVAGEGTARDVFWTVAIVINMLAILRFLWWGIKNIWADFKKHDEQVFDILKREKIDGQ